jgi:uncharacterized protein (DUF983 family)
VGGPFDDLEPSGATGPGDRSGTGAGPGERPSAGAGPGRAPTRARRSGEPGVVRALARGATRRCGRCGGGRLFRGWFRIERRCPRCGLRLEREEGGFLGAMTINYAVTAVVWLVVVVAWLVVDLPDVHVAALTITSIAVAVLVPLAFWPFSKSIWAAVDYLVYRTDPAYARTDAADHVAGNGGPPG